MSHPSLPADQTASPDIHPAPAVAHPSSNTAPVAIRSRVKTRTPGPAPADSVSAADQMPGPSVSASPHGSNTSAPLPDCLLENKLRRENRSHTHLLPSAQAPSAAPASPSQNPSRDTQSPPARSETERRPDTAPAQPQASL